MENDMINSLFNETSNMAILSIKPMDNTIILIAET